MGVTSRRRVVMEVMGVFCVASLHLVIIIWKGSYFLLLHLHDTLLRYNVEAYVLFFIFTVILVYVCLV
jgi:hypothetical protein